jgi:hypothetical protein
MKLAKGLLLAALAACLPLKALADNAIFTNTGGTFNSNSTNTFLTLSGSSLSQVQGLGAWDCPPCSGTATLVTGTVMSGSLLGSAMFNAGGSFNATNSSPMGGFVFTGQFEQGATWTKTITPLGPVWRYVGTVINASLTLGDGGGSFQDLTAVTVQQTTLGGNPVHHANGHYTWTNSQGTTNFPSPVPEPGTLGLFGTGLICLGLVARRKLSGMGRVIAPDVN